MHNPRRLIIPVLILVILIGGIWYLLGRSGEVEKDRLRASGAIEATQVIIAPELGGKIFEVLVEEGDVVQDGQVLIRFDDTLLQTQLEQAAALLALANANYDLVAAGPTKEERQIAITSAQLELIAAWQALDNLYKNADLKAANALQDIASARKAIDSATNRRNTLLGGADQVDIDAARATVTLAKDRLERAREDFAPYENKQEDNTVRAALLSRKAAMQEAYDSAVTRLNNLLAEANELDLALVDADLALAQALFADAQRRFDILKNGPDPDELALASAKIESAEAHLAAARAEPSAEQLSAARAQVDSATTGLAVIQAQLEKLILKAPLDGVVLSVSANPGEVASLGTPLLTIGYLDDLTITVYIPEDRYGTIQLGQVAQVKVDSFPDLTFSGKVIRIADQAEFTPRNVQTEEGRRTMVFSVKLAVANPEGKLKPGMPADVDFGE